MKRGVILYWIVAFFEVLACVAESGDKLLVGDLKGDDSYSDDVKVELKKVNEYLDESLPKNKENNSAHGEVNAVVDNREVADLLFRGGTVADPLKNFNKMADGVGVDGIMALSQNAVQVDRDYAGHAETKDTLSILQDFNKNKNTIIKNLPKNSQLEESDDLQLEEIKLMLEVNSIGLTNYQIKNYLLFKNFLDGIRQTIKYQDLIDVLPFVEEDLLILSTLKRFKFSISLAMIKEFKKVVARRLNMDPADLEAFLLKYNINNTIIALFVIRHMIWPQFINSKYSKAFNSIDQNLVLNKLEERKNQAKFKRFSYIILGFENIKTLEYAIEQITLGKSNLPSLIKKYCADQQCIEHFFEPDFIIEKPLLDVLNNLSVGAFATIDCMKNINFKLKNSNHKAYFVILKSRLEPEQKYIDHYDMVITAIPLGFNLIGDMEKFVASVFLDLKIYKPEDILNKSNNLQARGIYVMRQVFEESLIPTQFKTQILKQNSGTLGAFKEYSGQLMAFHIINKQRQQVPQFDFNSIKAEIFENMNREFSARLMLELRANSEIFRYIY